MLKKILGPYCTPLLCHCLQYCLNNDLVSYEAIGKYILMGKKTDEPWGFPELVSVKAAKTWELRTAVSANS